MSYHTRPALQRYRSSQAPLGIWPFSQIAEFVVGPQGVGEQTVCVKQGNDKTAELDAKIKNLQATWTPTGYYSPDQLLAVVAETMKLVSDASTRLGAAPRSTDDAESQIRQQLKDLFRHSATSLDFIAAANTAKNRGIGIIDSPGLKSWVVRTMNSASVSIAMAYTYDCVVSGFQRAAIALSFFRDLLDRAIAFIKTVAGVAYDAAKAVLHLAAGALDLAGNVVKYAKWGVLAGVGVWIFLEIKKRQK